MNFWKMGKEKKKQFPVKMGPHPSQFSLGKQFPLIPAPLFLLLLVLLLLIFLLLPLLLLLSPVWCPPQQPILLLACLKQIV